MKKRIRAIYDWWLDWKINDKLTSTLINVTLVSIITLTLTYYAINTRQAADQRGAQWVALGNQILMRNAEKVTDQAKILETLSRTPLLIEAVKKANSDRAGWKAESIISQDKSWKEKDPSIEAEVNAILNNDISAYLTDFQQNNPQEVEIFVTDLRGLNIAMTDRTSDFLQADEDWWASAFADGKGTTYLSPVEYDDSAHTYAMDIGVPILDPQTKRAIGVLRGTVDISAVINSLKDVDVGSTGNIILMDHSGIVLYSRNQQDFMKTVPDFIFKLVLSDQSNWKRSKDMGGKQAVVAFSSLEEDADQSLGWHILITQTEAEANQGVIRSLFISVLTSILVMTAGVFVSRIVLTNALASPLNLLTNSAHELSVGNVTGNENQKLKQMQKRKDEIGEIKRAFDRLTVYFQAAASASIAIANKDLTLEVTANSESDVLGNAFAKMVAGLRDIIFQVAESTASVSAASAQLSSTANESKDATNQIATTIQQVSIGITQQSEDVTKTSYAVEQLEHSIESIAQGTLEQATAISKASRVTADINTAIGLAASNARSSAQGAIQAAESARSGTRTVEATLAGMQSIKAKVGMSMQKVREMGKRSEQIDTIIETINDIAAQTNLLALNAAIEAARVQAKGEKTVESMLQKHMLGMVNLISDILASGRELDSNDLVSLARLAQVDDFCIADEDGVIFASNRPASVGFRFSEDPRQESSVFRSLLRQRDGVVVRPIMVRDQDGRPYIYVGVSRRDRPGIVQAGSPADLVYSLGGYSRGFAVVANEVGKLAEHAKASTKEVASLIRGLQKAVGEAVTVMEDGTREVEDGSVRAAEAGEALSIILKSAETVSQQVDNIAAAIQQMGSSSTELVSAMETVNSIVKKNTAAAEEMAANSSELTQAVENIASVSEENSASVEEVSASTEEVLNQVEQVSSSAVALMQLAKDLQSIIAQFALSTTPSPDAK